MWNYELELLQANKDVLATIDQFRIKEDLEAHGTARIISMMMNITKETTVLVSMMSFEMQSTQVPFIYK